MAFFSNFMSRRTGWRKRTDREELALRVMMLQGTHLEKIAEKARDELGGRWNKLGPLDFTRNPLLRQATVLSTAHEIPAGVSRVPLDLMLRIGDSSSATLYKEYAKIGYLPMPTELRRISAQVELYLVTCHYCSVYHGWDRRARAPFMSVITPDVGVPEYDHQGPRMPTGFRHDIKRRIGKDFQNVTDVYDISDLDRPFYRVMIGPKDVTEKVHGQTFEGENYPRDWRKADGEPIMPIVVYGRAENVHRGVEIVEATLRVAVGWSWWWAGVRDACFKGRNVRGMALESQDSAMSTDESGAGATGIEDGAEIVQRWIDDNPDRPGQHWQWDAPFDAEGTGRSISTYETQALTQTGVAVDLTMTGGEPLAHEITARRRAAMKHYDDLRSGDAASIVVQAIIANRNSNSAYPEDMNPGIGYNEEITALRSEKPAVEAQNGGRTDDDRWADGSTGADADQDADTRQ